MKTLNSLIKDFRKQLHDVEKIDQEIALLQSRIDELCQNALDKRNQAAKLKTLIDWCVYTGDHPTEAVLQRTSAELRKEFDRLQPHQLLYHVPVSYVNSTASSTSSAVTISSIFGGETSV